MRLPFSGGERKRVPNNPVEPTGHHDLEQVAAEVWNEFFPQHPRLPIRWGKRSSAGKRNSIRLGSYDHSTLQIRIHPSLNAPTVPAYFIKSIIYHEYLHHVLGPSHNTRFRRWERRFPFYREARAWLKRNLPVLLGRTPRELAPPPRPTAVKQLSLF